MNNLMIKNWNEKITPQDKVFFLGDFALHMRLPDMEAIFEKLNGDKHLIVGNHDRNNKVHQLKWGSVHDVMMVDTPGQGSFWLSHYPHRSWPRSFHGSFHLHGHCHGKMSPYTNSLDVGMDCHNYYPLSLDEVLQKIPRGKLES